jgi:hypothetical protein
MKLKYNKIHRASLSDCAGISEGTEVKAENKRNGFARKGFAIIATLMIMILLTVLAFAMMSLSTTTTRSSNITGGMAEAKANARMALMIAIGELQRHTGADTRITAPAEILEAGAPPLTGVWRSWEGTNHDSTGRPITPDYTVKTSREADGGRFLTWLVSGAQVGQEPLSPAPSDLVSSVATADTIPLLSTGSLGANPGQVHVAKQLLQDESGVTTGSYAWWVSPENQKARLMQPHLPRTNDEVGWADQAKSHAIPDVADLGLEDLLDDPELFAAVSSSAKPLSKFFSRKTITLLNSTNTEDPQYLFHDYSSSAAGLLTNTATGGWRKDMSILTEKWGYQTTTSATGVLTATVNANGIYARYPGARLPLFRYSPTAGSTSAVPLPTAIATATATAHPYDVGQSGFYPWSGYSQFSGSGKKAPFTWSTASSSWQSLVNFATRYKTITYDGSTNTARLPIGWSTVISPPVGNPPGTPPAPANFYNYYHTIDPSPVIARIQLMIQVNAIPESSYISPSPGTNVSHRLNMRVVPIFTIWNPYNVELRKTVNNFNMNNFATGLDLGIGTERSLPLAVSFANNTVPGVPTFANNFKLINGGNGWPFDGAMTGVYDHTVAKNTAKGYGTTHYNKGRGFSGWLPLEFTLKPGEVKVFSPAFDEMPANDGSSFHTGIRLKEGYATGDNFGFERASKAQTALTTPDADLRSPYEKALLTIPSGRPTVAPRMSGQVLSTDVIRFGVKADRHTAIFANNTATGPGTGPGSHWSVGTTRPGWGVNLAQIAAGQTNKGVDPQNQRASMAAVVDETWAAKYWPSNELDEIQYTVSDIVPGGGNPPWTDLYSISFGPRFTFGAGLSANQKRPLKGILQSSPFVSNTYSIPTQTGMYHPANNAYDLSYHSMSINSNLTPEVGQAGYIVSGFQNGDGLSRLIMAEIPLRPMASLVELQSWNLRGGNPQPPYQCNLIGNSDATPLIQQGGILPTPAPVDALTNLQHDDAYCGNHLLFDDWFLSTIAAQPSTFGSSIGKTAETVYQDFLQGTAPLTNRAYRPIHEDRLNSAAVATAKVAEIVNSTTGDGWLKVASRFEVDGMFNVNSTSVKAWRALLGHARKQQLSTYGASGINLDSSEHEYPVSRHTVAGDVEASTAPGLGATFPSGSEYSGFRTLSDAQLDELAENIVEQVQKRGPFLSLSEFVNRQLNDSDEELALAGALQTALNSLTTNPNENLKALSNVTMDPNDTKIEDAGFGFEKAIEGVDTFGLPGWIRQADILRPIAPILSARDDTFTIRAYGDSRDTAGNIIARAWCEAVVKRTREYVDPADDADSINPPVNPANQSFGRKYIISSFRWLNAEEV